MSEQHPTPDAEARAAESPAVGEVTLPADPATPADLEPADVAADEPTVAVEPLAPAVPAADKSPAELLADLATLPADDAAPALQQLGRLPLEKGKFPVMGYLATVYDTLGGVLPEDD